MITITNTKFEFAMQNEFFAKCLYDNWDEFCRNSVERVMDDCLSRFDSPEECIRIETLTLDLGKTNEENFYERFPKLLAESLEEKLKKLLLNADNYSEQIQIISTKRNLLELIEFYLIQGYMPYETEFRYTNIEYLFNEAIKNKEPDLKNLILNLGASDYVRERLVYQLSDGLLGTIISLIEPAECNFINSYSGLLVSLYPNTGRPEISKQNFRDIILNLIFAYLLYPNRGYFNRKQFVKQTIQHLARRYNMNALKLIDLLSGKIKSLTGVRAFYPELFQILTDLRNETSLDKPVPEKEQTAYSLKETSVANKPAGNKPAGINISGPRKKTIEVKDNRKIIEIDNAGIVLLAPFFPNFFYKSGYLSPDKKHFRDRETHQRVVLALQTLLSDHTAFQETDLILNKLLTGYPLSEPVPKNIELTQPEKDATGQLLRSVLSYWEKLKNTSPEGLKEAFLHRKGKLEEFENKWVLTVEHRSYDILLESLPWSFKLIKFPFIQKIIIVEWYQKN